MNELQEKEFTTLKDNVISLKTDLHEIKKHLLGNEDLKDDGYLARMEMRVALQEQQIENLKESIDTINKLIEKFNGISNFAKGAFYLFVALVGVIGTVIAIITGFRVLIDK